MFPRDPRRLEGGRIGETAMTTRDQIIKDRVIEFLIRTEGQVHGKILTGHPLSRLTTFHIGGPSAVVAIPDSMEEMDYVREAAADCSLPFKVLGRGSNIIASDRGYQGVIILKVRRGMHDVQENKGIVEVDAGVALNRLVLWCADKGLGGLESLVGIPGTLGGAIINNAGARGQEISDRLMEVLINEAGKGWRWVKRKEMDFSYRHSSLNGMIYKAKLKLDIQDREALLQECRKHQDWRKASQPLSRHSAGSVFRNGEGYLAGELIDRCGCKGWRIGDAMVSEKHANFIVNTGHAQAWQVMDLIRKVQRWVLAREGVKLELEIEQLGDFRRTEGKARG